MVIVQQAQGRTALHVAEVIAIDIPLITHIHLMDLLQTVIERPLAIVADNHLEE